MISIKKLAGGGDVAVKEMLDRSAMLGIDLIELLWIPRNKLPHYGVLDVIGYKVPVINNSTNIYDEERPSSEWIDGTAKFYPDDAGRCWGYIYDTEENRLLLASSLANGWFRIVDKKYKDEIVELAKKKNYPTEPYPTTQVLVKRGLQEKIAESQIKTLERRELEMKERLEELERELIRVKGEKSTYVNKRLKGTVVPESDKEV